MRKFIYKCRIPFRGEIHGEVYAVDIKSAKS